MKRCCAVNDGTVHTVTSFDLFIGACLSSTNVSLRVLPDRWWKRMFRHSAELKDPRTLTSLYEAWRTKLGIVGTWPAAWGRGRRLSSKAGDREPWRFARWRDLNPLARTDA